MRPMLVFSCCAFALSLSSAARADGFTLESASFGSNTTLGTSQVYNKGDCHGGNVSPELHWSGAPAETRSFAVTLFDPDARDGAGWWHWLLFDIDVKTKSLSAGAGANIGSNTPPGAISGTNSFGDLGYSGPCPPRDDKPHRYVFTIYALSTEHLDVAPGADGEAVKKALTEKSLSSAGLQGQYGR
jgi:Raf kinase inhibitor-like YbhB/YbcL family protein